MVPCFAHLILALTHTRTHIRTHAHAQHQTNTKHARKHARARARTHAWLFYRPLQARAESLAADFHKRLGEDKQVSVAAASKDKLVMKIKGDDAFANEMVTAAQSFPETGDFSL